MQTADEFPHAARLRTAQIIHGALLAGVVNFMLIAVFIVARTAPVPPDPPLLTLIALAVGGMQLVLHRFVAGLVTSSPRRRLAQGKYPEVVSDETVALWGVYQLQMIVADALLESGCFLLLIAYLIEGKVTSFVGAGLLLAVMAVQFPTRSRVVSWVDAQKELLYQERVASRS